MNTINLNLVKKHLNIDETFTDDDLYLVLLIDAVENLIIKKLDIDTESGEDGAIKSNLCRYRDEETVSGCVLNLTKDKICPVCCPYMHKCKIELEPALLQGMLLMIANLYANREPASNVTLTKIPYTLDYILESYKNYSIV